MKLIVFILFVFSLNVYSQKGDTVDVNEEKDYETIIENQTEDIEDSELIDRLDRLRDNPININSAEANELQLIPYIDGVVAKNILIYRKKNKKFKSISELKSVQGIDDELYRKIKPFVIVKNSKLDFVRDETGKIKPLSKNFLFNDFNLKTRSRVSQDLQEPEGFKDNSYVGTRPKIYNKLEMQYTKNNYSVYIGGLAEKDPGEKKIFDFISGFAELKSITFAKQIIAGDYTLEFGQGITLWSSLAYSKGSDAVATIKKKGDGIDTYTSVNEVQYYRGAAFKLKLPVNFADINLYGFFSNNFLDATTTIDTINGNQELSTMYVDGYHRTQSEINRDNSSREKLFGGRIELVSKIIGTTKLGLTYYNSKFDTPFKFKSIYDFSGTTSEAAGFDYDFVYQNVNLFGEWARSKTGAIGGMSGAKFVFVNNVSFMFAVRNYPKDFVMLHSNGFGEQGGATQNEFGIYTGMKIKLGKFLILNAYFDQFKFPYETFLKPIPTSGNDLLVHSEWKVGKGLKLFTRFRSKSKEDITSVINEFGTESKEVYTRNQKNYRLQFDYDFTKDFRVRSRGEYVFVNYDSYFTSQKGLLFYSDFRFKPIDKLSIDGRVIFFQTDSYDSRIYEYESELEGVVSNQGLYGKGRRWYILLKYKPYPFLSFSGRYAETYYDGAKSIGTGSEEVIGDFKNRLSFQLDIKF